MMGRSVELFQVDAFTDKKFAGNPAGVVLGAEVLTEPEMRCIARELGHGDTAFVFAPSNPAHDLDIRFYTPRSEAAFVGHATLAAHAVLNQRDPKPVRKQLGKTGAVEVRCDGNRFAITQAAPAAGTPVADAHFDEALRLCGLNRSQLDRHCPAQIMGSASTRLLIGVNTAADLDALDPQLDALAKLSPHIGAQGYFIFTRQSSVLGCDTEARMFCPTLGINEDPVSGNAHGLLGAYLQSLGLIATTQGVATFAGAQGRHVGRPGRVEVELRQVEIKGRQTATVTIAGTAVIVFRSQLEM
jgi:PhzF family phenazine biosynthesis protein